MATCANEHPLTTCVAALVADRAAADPAQPALLLGVTGYARDTENDILRDGARQIE